MSGDQDLRGGGMTHREEEEGADAHLRAELGRRGEGGEGTARRRLGRRFAPTPWVWSLPTGRRGSGKLREISMTSGPRNSADGWA